MGEWGDFFYPDNPKRRDQVQLLVTRLKDLAQRFADLKQQVEANRGYYTALLLSNATLSLTPRKNQLTGDDIEALTRHLDLAEPVMGDFLAVEFPDYAPLAAASNGTWNVIQQYFAAQLFDLLKTFASPSVERDQLESAIADLTPKVDLGGKAVQALETFNHALTAGIADEIRQFAVLDATYTLLAENVPTERYVLMENSAGTVCAVQSDLVHDVALHLPKLQQLRQYMASLSKSADDIRADPKIVKTVLSIRDDGRLDLYLRLLEQLPQSPTTVQRPEGALVTVHNEGFAPAACFWIYGQYGEDLATLEVGDHFTQVTRVGSAYRFVFTNSGYEGFFVVGWQSQQNVHLTWNPGRIAQHPRFDDA